METFVLPEETPATKPKGERILFGKKNWQRGIRENLIPGINDITLG